MTTLRSIPNVRNSDPVSSHAAAHTINQSGRRQTNLAKVMTALREHEGSTAGELSVYLPELDYHEVVRRLSDAEKLGKAFTCGKRKCSARGTQAREWYVVGASYEEAA